MDNARLDKLLEFIKNEPNDEFLKYALATEYLRLNQTDRALTYYEELVNNHPNYTGTYYHLGKLLERVGNKEKAVKIYERGMLEAKKAGDNHTYNELQGAYEDLIDE